MAVSIKKISSGFGWILFSNAINRLFGFGTTLILAKLLSPEHFGLVAAAESMVAVLKTFKDMGLGQALIQTSRKDHITNDTAFIMIAFLSVFLFVSALILAPLASRFLESPDLVPVLIVMSSNIIALTVKSVPDAIIRKGMDFHKFVIPDLISVIIASVVGIVMAFSGFGVWSLVIRTLIFYWLNTLMVWLVSRYRPRLKFDREIAAELFSYSKFVVGATILSMALSNLDRIFITKMEGMVSLGIYTLAMALAHLPVSEFGHMVCRVIFPLFSTVKDSLPDLQKHVKQALTVEALVTIPMAFGLLVYGPTLVDLIFEKKWQGLGVALQILTVGALFRAISVVFEELLRAIGRPNTVQHIIFLRLIILVIGAYPSIILWDLPGFCWLITFCSILALLVELRVVLSVLQTGLRNLLKPLFMPGILAGIAVGGTYSVLLSFQGKPQLGIVATFIIITIILYFSGIYLLAKNQIKAVIREIRRP